jgi:glycosyltransferase involved in cell wall biosynthesis
MTNQDLDGFPSVVLVGPQIESSNPSYGGGAGGIVSACLRLIKWYKAKELSYTYVPYSVRQRSSLWILHFPVRMVLDFIRFSSAIDVASRRSVVHLIVDGGASVVRSVVFSWYAKRKGFRIISDVRGNAIVDYSGHRDPLSYLWRLLIIYSDCLLVQNPLTVDLLSSRHAGKFRHHPNWIEHPIHFSRDKDILSEQKMEVVFVGYCYQAKGVFDAVLGCKKACISGLEIRLTFIGEQHPEFAKFCDELPFQSGFEIQRLGKLCRTDILSRLLSADIFLFPTYHPGEGHPNVINEALFAQLLIVTTKAGAIGEILNDESAVFIEPNDPDMIAIKLIGINSSRSEMKLKARHAHNIVLPRFLESKVLGDLFSIYKSHSH